jgi:hypothetical protein
MSMPVESLEVLEQADVAPAQARAIVRAIEIELSRTRDALTTKEDFESLRQDVGVLKQDVAVLKQDVAVLKQDVAVLKHDVGVLKQEFATFRVEVRTSIETLHRELYESQAKLRADLLGELHASVGGVTRQVYLALMGQVGVLLGFVYFFTTHLR